MTTIKQLFDIAVSRLESGSLTEAENLFLQISEQHPDEPNTLHRLAEIALRKRRYESAAELLAKVTAKRPDHPDVPADLARAYIGMGRHADAIACLGRAQLLDPENG